MIENVRLIVMDMDGTLLNDKNQISQKTKDALLKVQKKGIRLVLASGRSYKTLMSYGKELEMDKYHGWFIGVNGGALTDVSSMENSVISQISQQESREILNVCHDYGIEVMGVLDDTIYDYIPDSLKEIKKEMKLKSNIDEDVWTAGSWSLVTDQRKGYPNIFYTTFEKGFSLPVNKVCLAHLPNKINDIFDEIKLKLKNFEVAKTTPQWVECTPKGINKGIALKKLCDKLNISLSEVVVFGDGENDLSMFKNTHSVAMGNAMESVKKAAEYVTNDNKNDGIGEFINKYIL